MNAKRTEEVVLDGEDLLPVGALGNRVVYRHGHLQSEAPIQDLARDKKASLTGPFKTNAIMIPHGESAKSAKAKAIQ